MPDVPAPLAESSPSLRACRAGVAIAALWTLCSHAVVAAGGSLRELIALFAAASAAAAWGAWRARAAASWHPSPEERRAELALWATAAACALYALVAHRPDADDAFYLNLAIAALDHPELPLLSADTLHGLHALPIHYASYRLHAFELGNAALAWATGLPPAWAFHVVSTALAAAAVPLAHAALLRRLLPERWLAATLVLAVLLAGVGETHRWYGNFAFVRMGQGKAALLFVWLPLVWALALDVARRPGWRSALWLAAAQIAALGASAAGVWLAPCAAALALLSQVDLRRPRAALHTLALGLGSSLYALVAGALVKGSMSAGLPTLARVHAPGALAADALSTVLGDGALRAAGLLALAFGWLCFPAGAARRFAAGVPLGAAVLLLHPFADVWVRAHLTGPAYWRALWLVPIPLLLAAALSAPLAWAGPRHRALGAGAAALATALFVALVPTTRGWSAGNGVTLRAPGAKRPPAAARAAERINALAPGRAVVAPEEVSTWIPTWRQHAYPLFVRHYLRPQRARLGEQAYRERRVMTRLAGGEPTAADALALFAEGLARHEVALVCLRRSPRAQALREVLRGAGFATAESSGDYEIWLRRP